MRKKGGQNYALSIAIGMGLWRCRVKKIGPLPLSSISSFSVSAKNSIKLCKYAADFASALRFILSALVCFTPQTLQVQCGPRLRLCKCAAVKHKFRHDRRALAKFEVGLQRTYKVWGVDRIALETSLMRDCSTLAKSEAWTAAYLQSLRQGLQPTCKASGRAASHLLVFLE